jgi:hypothetical protein
MESNEIKKMVDSIKKLKEIEEEAKAKRKKLEESLFLEVEKPIDGKPVWLADDTKIVWRANAKINQRAGRIWMEKNPELSKRVFSISLKPKISEISKLERTLNLENVPKWLSDLETLKEDIQVEEKPSLQFIKNEEAEEDE